MFSKFIPDFSARQEYKKHTPPTVPKDAPQPPKASEYLSIQPPLPVKYVTQSSSTYSKKDHASALPSVSKASFGFGNMTMADPLLYNTGFAPNIATTPTLGSSYFATLNDVMTNGGSIWSKFPALQDINIAGFNISSIGSITAQNISTTSITAQNISTTSMDAAMGNISSLTTRIIELDGNFLTTDNGAGGELLLNGVPLATLCNISSLADWSYYAAVSTIHMDGNDINRLKSLKFDSINGSITGLSTINGSIYPNPNADASLWANFPAISSINVNNQNLLAISTLTATDGNITNVSASTIQTNLISTSQIQASTIQTNLISTFQVQAIDLMVSTITVSTINNLEYPPPNSDVSQWATFSAVAKIDVNDLDLNNVSSVVFVGGANKLTTNPSNQLTYNGTVITTGDNASQWSRYSALQTVAMNAQTLNDTRAITGNGANLDIDVTGTTGSTSILNLKAENGVQGEINITAGSGDLNVGGGLVHIKAEGGAPSLAGLYGHVLIEATYGQVGLVSPIYTGGLIELNATSGPGVGATSAIKLSAAGVNSYAGAIPSFGSLLGYNQIYGNLGVNICAGIPSIFPNVPLTTFIYGTAGIELGSDTYVRNIYPYYNGVATDLTDLTIHGRDVGVYSSFVVVANTGSIDFDSRGPRAITGLSTINGIPWPTPASGAISSISNYGAYVTCTGSGAIALDNTSPTSGSPLILVRAKNTLQLQSQSSDIILAADNYDTTQITLGGSNGNINIDTVGGGGAGLGNIYLNNALTQFVIGSAADTPPATGLFIDSTRLLFNNAPITGTPGAPGGSTSYFPYQADNGTTPATGHITWQNFATQISSTYIRVNHIDQDGVDIDIFLNLIIQGTTLILQDANVSANYQRWIVSGTPTYNTGSGYAQYPITLSASGGTTNFANNHQIILAVVQAVPVAWRAGGIDTQDSVTILTTNTNVPVNTSAAGIVANGTAKYFISGQIGYAAAIGLNTVASWTLARSTALPATTANSTNLASGGGLLSANLINTNPYRLGSILTPATYSSTCPVSIVDTPPAGTYWYSLFAQSSAVSAITAENVVITVLQVSP